MSEKKKIPVILDGDPGHDDAIGWVLASTIPDFDIRAITTVAGNQTLAHTRNTNVAMFRWPKAETGPYVRI